MAARRFFAHHGAAVALGAGDGAASEGEDEASLVPRGPASQGLFEAPVLSLNE